MSYSDKQRVEIAEQEYENYEQGNEVTIGKNKEKVGIISQINNKSSGEQSFVVTDIYVPTTASLKQRSSVKEVTVLYRGSSFNATTDAAKDWLLNDIPTGVQVINSGGATAMPQLKSSAETLKNVLTTYPNAEVFVYGHSLGSMNAQYAVSDLSAKDSERIMGGFFYEGPNVYPILSPKQQATANALSKANKLFNYVDGKDLIAIGYGEGKTAVGNVVRVHSKKTGMIDQHMWGGYAFDKTGI